MSTATSTLDELLDALEEADNRLRALYLHLAEDPDVADELAAELQALQTARRRLAEQVGLAVLAQRRSSTIANEPLELASSVANEDDDSSREATLDDSEASAPKPPPLSTEAIAEWTQDARANGLGQASYADQYSDPWEHSLARLLVDVGVPRELELDVAGELDALDRVSADDKIGDWARLPRHVQQVWLSALVARTRSVKSLRWLTPVQCDRVRTIIERYPRWAKAAQPGHVNGLKRDHEPKSDSWAEDAQRLWTVLLKEIAPTSAPAPMAASPVRVKKGGRDESGELAVDVRPIDPSWRLWPLVRGRHAILAGGDPREPNRERLERAFELSALEWADVSKPRRVAALVARLRQRRVDLVIVLAGFVDHKQSEPIVEAAKSAGVAWAVSDGYGAASIKLALERYLAVPPS